MVSVTIIPSRGNYRADSMVLLFVVLGLVVAGLPALFGRRAADPRIPSAWAENAIIAVLVGFTVTRLIDQRLLANAIASSWRIRLLLVGQLLLVASYRWGNRQGSDSNRWRNLRFALFCLTTVLAGLEVLRLIPVPPIDVWRLQMDGANALLHGLNPFVAVQVHDTAPDSLRTDIPYVYPPLQVLLTLPTILLGDVRFTMIAAVIVLAVALRRIVRGGTRANRLPAIVEDAPALFVLLAPKLYFVIEQSWIDPVQAALIAVATALAVDQRKRAAAVTLGFVLVSKQSMFWVVPLFAVAFGFGAVDLAIVVVVACLIEGPFALWNFHALKYANFDILKSIPPREDALSFTNWANRALRLGVPAQLGFALAAASVALSVFRIRRAELFGTALATTYFFFFAFNKWAFANYYFLVACAFALAAAMRIAARSDSLRGATQL